LAVAENMYGYNFYKGTQEYKKHIDVHGFFDQTISDAQIASEKEQKELIAKRDSDYKKGNITGAAVWQVQINTVRENHPKLKKDALGMELEFSKEIIKMDSELKENTKKTQERVDIEVQKRLLKIEEEQAEKSRKSLHSMERSVEAESDKLNKKFKYRGERGTSFRSRADD
jgi:hypothetical protein